MTDRRRVAVLGSTGSVGTQALEVLDAARETHQLVALAAGSRWQQVVQQAAHFDMEHVLLDDPAARERLAAARSVQLAADVGELLDRTAPDLVLNAVVGFAGLAATVAALERGIDVALANKESLVAAGALCTRLAGETDARLIPVDSEHSALLQCLAGSTAHEVESLVLTASGGPFRGRTREQLADVSVESALAHPTWNMGGKITIDSATLMNKGLELIEAMWLFDVPESHVEVVVHPHSIVHALVRHRDQSLLAHLGWPDMRVPIAWALHYPERPVVAAARPLDLLDTPPLEFEPPDLEVFECLALARACARAGGGMPCVLNAANEVAVEAFLAGQIGFLDVADVVRSALEQLAGAGEPASLEQARELDARARAAASARLVA